MNISFQLDITRNARDDIRALYGKEYIVGTPPEILCKYMERLSSPEICATVNVKKKF